MVNRNPTQQRIGHECLKGIYEWGLAYGNLLNELGRPREGAAEAVAVDMQFGKLTSALRKIAKDCPLQGAGKPPTMLMDWLSDIKKRTPDVNVEATMANLDEFATVIKDQYLRSVTEMYSWTAPKDVLLRYELPERVASVR